ncbi:cyclophilin-like protein [Thelephora ganbajun]|uniref:Cyclophilin-like protein n=1 Tax=Thelephora ganbajun TaxID=370292 RepID=A0ACB6ZV41_THEGA|nr:cyclophilin-like protein [Thelephora ganbajun]
MALPTRGRVIINTTAGELDIELWSRECPKACRNFITLAMEGYYDGVIFHRIVPNFLVQTGDRTGSGGGGESIYGEPFEDEIHPRLRFPHRGLVACANNGTKNSNDSQFFITLDRAEELHGKHTAFGRCVGDTIYNVMKIGAMEIDKNERPIYPPKIKSIRIVDNPFDDIVPRITAEEKRAQQRAREQAQKEREEAQRRKGAKKDTKLLSFGGEEGEEEEEPASFKKKPLVRPDLVDDPEDSVTTATIPDFVTNISSKPSRGTEKDEAASLKVPKHKDVEDIKGIREKHAKEQASKLHKQAEIQKLEADIRKLSKRTGGKTGGDSDDSDSGHAKKKTKPSKSYLEEELAKYSKGRLFAGGEGRDKDGKRKKRDESDVLAVLDGFRGRLKDFQPTPSTSGSGKDRDPDRMDVDKESGEGAVAEGRGLEVDTDRGFLGHLLTFPKGNSEEVSKAEREYEVIDPRQRGARAKQEERDRRNAARGRGGRGRR